MLLKHEGAVVSIPNGERRTFSYGGIWWLLTKASRPDFCENSGTSGLITYRGPVQGEARTRQQTCVGSAGPGFEPSEAYGRAYASGFARSSATP